MTGPTGVLSDSSSTLHLQNTNNPFLTRALFEVAAASAASGKTPAQENDDDDDDDDDDGNNNSNIMLGLRTGSSSIGALVGTSTIASTTTATATAVMSRSLPLLPHLLLHQISSITARKHYCEQQQLTAEKKKTIIQHTIIPVPVPEKEWVLATMQFNSSNSEDKTLSSLGLNPFSPPYSPSILDTEKFVSNHYQTTTIPKTLIDLNEYCQRVDVRPREDDDEDSDEEEQEEASLRDEKVVIATVMVLDEEKVPQERKDPTKEEKKILEIEFCNKDYFNLELLAMIDDETTDDVPHHILATEETITAEVAEQEEEEEEEEEEKGHLDQVVTSETIIIEPAALETDNNTKDLIGSSISTSPQPPPIIIIKHTTTESEAIAKQWRRDQPTSRLLIQQQRPEDSTLEYIVHHDDGDDDTLSDSQLLEKRQRRRRRRRRRQDSASQGQLTMMMKSFESLLLHMTRKENSFSCADPSTPFVAITTSFSSSSSSSSSFSSYGLVVTSPIPDTITATPKDQESMLGDNITSIPTLCIPTDGNTTVVSSSVEQQNLLIDATLSAAAAAAAAIQGKKIKKKKSLDHIDTNLARSSSVQEDSVEPTLTITTTTTTTTTLKKTSDNKSVFQNFRNNTSMLFKKVVNSDEDQEEQQQVVISSKVSRKGKLFAKKIKTIAGFEYNTAKKLGKGNFGIVYQGKSIIHDDGGGGGGMEVAIKKITRKLPGEIEKLGLVQREMRVCRLFNNRTGIVPLLDIVTTSKHHYLIFEKAEGDLAEMIKVRCRDAAAAAYRTNKDFSMQQQPMSPSCSLGTIFNVHEIRSIMHTVVLGTRALHKEGYSHKDIKPANILLFQDGSKGVLCDFGLCSQVNELPQNQFFGTRDYASPEAR
ncbi:hypothetical protein BGZ65_006153, partial [Modicella reniformis]